MPVIKLEGSTAQPFGSYLKALGVLRLVADQADSAVRGWWEGDTFALEIACSPEDMLRFFLDSYRPTPIVAPWNGGSGFYPKSKHEEEGINSIAGTSTDRFAEYRGTISACRAFPEVRSGKPKDDDRWKAAILRRCRNTFSDRAVEWLDAAVGIAADGSAFYPPILGTGGNDGHLDFTNNFMARLAVLLISRGTRVPVRELLANALFGNRCTGLQAGAAGHYDPGRAGGANQGVGIEPSDTKTNPWDLVLTLEGTVAWASGLYRRQGVSYRSVLCSPFTVYPRNICYGSASSKKETRAEVWVPLWRRPARYAELRALLREGRASVGGRPATNTLEFAEAASSLGVDRGIDRFVRYSLLKRRGDSYIALPAGTFATGYRSNADQIREFQILLDRLSDPPKGAEDLQRGVEAAVYRALLTNTGQSMREMMAALGRLLRRITTATETRLPNRTLRASDWLASCEFETVTEVRIAAALASIWDRNVGPISDELTRAGKRFAWTGISLPDRLISVLQCRMQAAGAAELESNPLGGACEIDAGDITLFIEGSVDDRLIEDLLFAFLELDWASFEMTRPPSRAGVLPTYAVLKCLFLPGKVRRGDEPKSLLADRRILSLLNAGATERATDVATHRLRIAGFRPLRVTYSEGIEPRRLAASLLIPVQQGNLLNCGIFLKEESTAYA